MSLTLDVRHDGVLVNADRQHLSLPVDSNDTVRSLKFGSSENRLSRDSVHVYTLSRLDLIQVDETEFCDEVDDTVFGGDLHSDREIVCRFGREEYIDGFLLEGWVGSLVTNLDYVELVSAMSAFMLTLAPVPVLTANANNFVGFGAPSNLIFAKVAACPSIG